MKFKIVKLLVVMSIIASFFLVSTVMAQEEDLLDPNIPESWYNGPGLASEMGIDEYNQSPLLDQRVKDGELPPVEERLPEDPPVIEPYEDIGKYGGSAHIWFSTDLNFNNGGWQALTSTYLTRFGRSNPDGSKLVPSILRDWEYSNDYKTLTYFLRKGLKWSDGHPFTSEDFIYWWEHVANNKDLTPVSPENWSPALLKVEAPDKYTVSFHYGKSAPNQHLMIHMHGPGEGVFSNPKHYMKQFHINFRDEEELMAEVEEADLDLWDDYYEFMQSPAFPERGIRPTMNMYIVTERSTNRIVTERNPYFPFVDIEGNQLPYIDKVIRHKAIDNEMIKTKVVTGEATVAGNHLNVTDIPLYKNNEADENYRTLLYTSGNANWLAIQPNLTHKDPQLREILQDSRFRKALSYAIDREDINNKVFYGRAEPMQSTVLPQNKYYKQEYASAHIDYDPEKAQQLLDDIGMVDVNDDGYREFPNGDIFKPVLIYMEGEGPRTPILELVINKFKSIGLNIELKLLARDLYIERRNGNNFDISMWQLSAVTDLMFPNNLFYTFAPTSSWLAPWPGWGTWYQTGGEEGMEPPDEIKELLEKADIIHTSTDPAARDEAAEFLIKTQAEKLWTIGTVGLGPAPIIINENLKNVPEKGLWCYDVSFMAPQYPSQFYFDE